MTLPNDLATYRWTSALLDHLWQSTAVVLLAWLLTLALRNNSARVRYAIWLIASVKFLIPFELLTYAGARWSQPVSSGDSADLYPVVEQFTRPLREAPVSAATPTPQHFTVHGAEWMGALIAAVWFCGVVVLLMRWLVEWRRTARITRNAEPMQAGREFDALCRGRARAGIASPVRLLLSPAGMEPGVFGILRPVLLWPAGLSERLDKAQIEAIMAHEVEHVRRSDNLTSSIHTLVQAVFWFHPLVRWMSIRLSEERERACDESVIQQNARPDTYAESILKVCSFCLEPTALCVSGVSGADLKQRILRIMARRTGNALSTGRKCLLGLPAAFCVAAPVGFGILYGQSAAESKVYTWTPDMPKYEVASIKPAPGTNSGLQIMFSPTGVAMKNAPVQTLLELAFGVDKTRIVGIPDQVRSKSYDIQAKVSAEDAPRMSKLKMEQRRMLMLPLLEDRFDLKYHHEVRQVPVYALVIAKSGPKVKDSKPGQAGTFPEERVAPRQGQARAPIGEGMRMSPGNIQSRGGNISFLAHALSGMLGRTVIDKTNLAGNYDFSLTWTPDTGMRSGQGGPEEAESGGAADPGGPSLFTALEEQLGLKLESQKRPVDVIVIDHLDLPTAN